MADQWLLKQLSMQNGLCFGTHCAVTKTTHTLLSRPHKHCQQCYLCNCTTNKNIGIKQRDITLLEHIVIIFDGPENGSAVLCAVDTLQLTPEGSPDLAQFHQMCESHSADCKAKVSSDNWCFLQINSLSLYVREKSTLYQSKCKLGQKVYQVLIQTWHSLKKTTVNTELVCHREGGYRKKG